MAREELTPLHALAGDAGLVIDWQDAMSEAQQVSDDTLRTVLAALGLPAGTPAEIADSRAARAEQRQRDALSFVTAPVHRLLRFPKSAAGRARLVLEDGRSRVVELSPDGTWSVMHGIGQAGYHRLETKAGDITLAIAPSRCFGVRDAAPGGRAWAAAVQVPSLRQSGATAFGDLKAVGSFARQCAGHGADGVAISPIHALFPADASRFSPYAPSSRLFLNVLLADPSLLGDLPNIPPADGELIDWSRAIPERLQVLRQVFARHGAAVAGQVDGFAGAGGDELARHACFDALHAHFFERTGATGWQGWPAGFRTPDSDAVEQFAAENAEEVRFYLFLQWLADRSLAEAHRTATEAGMAIGLITDLAVGMDAGGSHAWGQQGEILSGLSVGAPPDILGPAGQDWGLTTFSPLALPGTGFDAFLATMRSAMRHAGGVRVDHVLGLRRLWVIPHGASPADGVYLRFPEADLFNLLALESHRTRSIVIGEDLGTVPEGFRELMSAQGVLGMRVLWFEKDEAGRPLAPEEWDEDAVAMTSTHDLPTVAGWWSGRDIDWNWTLGRKSRFASREAEEDARVTDRAELWSAFVAAGVAMGDAPSPDEPGEAVDAAVSYAAAARSDLAIIPVEDILGLAEQPNIPGTTDEHPNWRRRLPQGEADMFADPVVRRRLGRISGARRK